MQVADLFRAMGEPLRVRLLGLLAAQGETCVCKLVEALEEPQPKISQHLRVLRQAGLVTYRREGPWAHYRLAPPRDELEAWLHTYLCRVAVGNDAAAEGGCDLGG